MFKFKGLINSSFQFFHNNSMEYEIFHTNKNGYILKRLPIYKVGKHLNDTRRIKHAKKLRVITDLLIASIIIRSRPQSIYPSPTKIRPNNRSYPNRKLRFHSSDIYNPRRLLILHSLTFRQKVLTRLQRVGRLHWSGEKIPFLFFVTSNVE